MKYLLILLTITSSLLAREVIHSSVSTYYENKTFKNSTQKLDGEVYGVGTDIHVDAWAIKATYEYAHTNTRQPPLKKDLEVQKLFSKVMYSFDDNLALNINYINILHDNIAITNHGESYGVGLTYNFNKKLETNFTQYFTDYKDFNVYQSDLKIDYKMKFNGLKMKISSITKYIDIYEKYKNKYTKFAKDDYLTTALKLHMHYNSYHMGLGAYIGKRAFAIMDDGFKIQHHAMEFDRTYAVGVGKSMGNFVLRGQYIYQRAIEMPVQNNQHVRVDNFRIIANYKF